jgi:hypothetical protein
VLIETLHPKRDLPYRLNPGIARIRFEPYFYRAEK